MAGNIVLTDRGLDFVLSANDGGPLIAITHFVPVYDYRIDPNIRPDDVGPLSAISAVSDETQSTSISSPFGEIIWRTTGHTLSNNTSIILSGGYDLTAHPESNVVAVNLYNGFPLSDSVSGTSYTVSANGNGTWTWNFTGQTDIVGVNDYSTVMFDVVDYYPVYSDSSNDELRGAWKCLIDTNIGRAKFNKIALYAQRYNGGSPTGDLEFFAEAYLEEPIIKSGLSQNGFDNIILDLQIDLHSISSTFENVFYSSSADYWSQSPGGLYYPNRIGVGHFQGSTYAISATMDLRKARDVNGNVDTSVPLIRLQYDDNSFNSIDQSPQTSAWRLTGGSKGGDIVIKVADWETYNGSVVAIRPYFCQTIALGTSAKPFRELWLTNISDPWNTPSINILNSVSAGIKIMDSETDYQVIIGNKANNSANRWGMKIRDLAIEIEGIGLNNSEDRSGALNLYGAYKGGDLWREGQNLLVYNAFCSNGSSDYDVQNIYLFAGLDLSANYTSIDGQVGATHKNIVYEIEVPDDKLFCSQNTKLSNTAQLHLAAKGKLGLFGPIELRNINENSLNTAIMTSFAKGSGSSLKGNSKLFIGAGIEEGTSFSVIANRVNDIDNNIPSYSVAPGDSLSWRNLLADEEYGSLHLVASNIWIDSDLSPVSNGSFDLGFGGQFGTLYVNRINMGISYDSYRNNLDNGEFTATYEKNSFLAGFNIEETVTNHALKDKINRKTILKKANSVDMYNNMISSPLNQIVNETISLGTAESYIDSGYFTNLGVTSLEAGELELGGLPAGEWRLATIKTSVENVEATNIKLHYSIINNIVCIKVSGQLGFTTGNLTSTKRATLELSLHDDLILGNITNDQIDSLLSNFIVFPSHTLPQANNSTVNILGNCSWFANTNYPLVPIGKIGNLHFEFKPMISSFVAETINKRYFTTNFFMNYR